MDEQRLSFGDHMVTNRHPLSSSACLGTFNFSKKTTKQHLEMMSLGKRPEYHPHPAQIKVGPKQRLLCIDTGMG
ncbi:MAG: hypothetical protein HYS06_03775 [Methylocystis sp.]|nr:hypothetical protein [Methylocystis sp.]